MFFSVFNINMLCSERTREEMSDCIPLSPNVSPPLAVTFYVLSIWLLEFGTSNFQHIGTKGFSVYCLCFICIFLLFFFYDYLLLLYGRNLGMILLAFVISTFRLKYLHPFSRWHFSYMISYMNQQLNNNCRFSQKLSVNFTTS